MLIVINNVNSVILCKCMFDFSVSIMIMIYWYLSAVNILKEGDIEESDNFGITFIVFMFVVMGFVVFSVGILIFLVYE